MTTIEYARAAKELSNIEDPNEAQTYAVQGWICPKCGRCLAPWMSECPCNYISLNGPTCNTRRFLYDFMTYPRVNYIHEESVTTGHNG